MKITITQISNGWVITVTPPGGEQQSSLFVPTFPEAVKQLEEMYKGAERTQATSQTGTNA